MRRWQMRAWDSWVLVLSAWGSPFAAREVGGGLFQSGWQRRFGVGCGGGLRWFGWRGFPWGQLGSTVVCFNLGRLLARGEAVVRLVPEEGVICCAKFSVEGDVLGGVDFHPACGGVPSEFAVIGDWVPYVIEVFSVMRCVAGVVVQGRWVEFGVGVGTPHVSGVGGLD